MDSDAILTAGKLDAIIGQAVVAALPTEWIRERASEILQDQIGRVSLDRAAPLLSCGNTRQLERYCRKNGIPILGTRKHRFILTRHIAEADERLALKANTQPTRILRVA